MQVYLDNSATTRQYDEVTDIMIKFMREDYGNPSSLHRMGLYAEKAIKQGRKQANEYFTRAGARDGEVIFTSGGTEADNLAILGGAGSRKKRGNKIITTEIEHPAVLESCKKLESMDFEVVHLPVSKEGLVDLDVLLEEIDERTIMISVMAVNNESGTVQPLQEICRIRDLANSKYKRDILLHTDAVQAHLNQPSNVFNGIDLISISGHKLHGPKGIGALFVRKGLRLDAQMRGGGQEGNVRSGTENVAAIAGFGKALELYIKGCGKNDENINSENKFRKLKFDLWNGLQDNIKDIVLNGPPVEEVSTGDNCISASGSISVSSPHILNTSFLGVRSEVLLHTLEQDGIYVSTGSACSSNNKGKSHVLKAMGKNDKEIEGAIRFSFGDYNSLDEVDYVIEKTKSAVAKFRKLGSFR